MNVLNDRDLYDLSHGTKILVHYLISSNINTIYFHIFRCYALAEITPDSPEFKKSNEKFERLTSEILENALSIDDAKEDNRLVKKLHEACGFEQVPLDNIFTVTKVITNK